MTIGSTAVSVSDDMTEGIVARFRTTPIHRGSVLTGHVVGSVLQSVASVVLVGAVAAAIGFRSTDATAPEWLAAFGLLALFVTALTWIAVGMGLVSPDAEAAGNNGWLAPAWCLALCALGHLWSRSVFDGGRK